MELSKYIEAIKSALVNKISSGIATVDAIMTPEGNIQGGHVAVNGKDFNLGNLFPIASRDEGIHIRFSIKFA